MSESKDQTPRILVVDDEPFYLELLNNALSPHFHVSLAKSGKQGLKRAMGPARPDLILLDIVMPGIDGYETCRALKENSETREIPVMFLTSRHDMQDELKGFELGAVDYITKPLSIPVVLSRVRAQLSLAQQRLALEQLVQERTRELERTKDAIVSSMGELAETRDQETGNHLVRTSQYVGTLARAQAIHPAYQGQLDERFIRTCERAAPLHDIGKIAIPDRVLQKASPLDDAEWEIMKQHPTLGGSIIENARKRIGSTLFIQVARDIALRHHEKWDGSGYPGGLKHTAIPLAARLMALADTYDALVNERYYKPAFSHEYACKWTMSKRATHFDPHLCDVFEQVNEQFQRVSEANRDR